MEHHVPKSAISKLHQSACSFLTLSPVSMLHHPAGRRASPPRAPTLRRMSSPASATCTSSPLCCATFSTKSETLIWPAYSPCVRLLSRPIKLTARWMVDPFSLERNMEVKVKFTSSPLSVQEKWSSNGPFASMPSTSMLVPWSVLTWMGRFPGIGKQLETRD